jgi:threonine dehydrogenase-like Zn-dependent dehydrogenase
MGHPFLGKRLNLVTSYGYPPDGHRWDARRSKALTLQLLGRGKLAIGQMITHHFSWQQLPAIYQRLDAGDLSIVGAIFEWKDAS